MAADLHMQDYPGVREAFLEAERQERVRTGRVASALVVFLMPLGTALEFALVIAARLAGQEMADIVRSKMLVKA